ncbi:CocE/NonD family hydrolase [Cupriavidus oxalaticus]|nr:CocE/NonD family hydrolase [Cupriavidus oxalaticus]
MFSTQEARDGYDVIEWIAAQNWSTGKVGQIGSSYGGIMSLAVAGQMPPHLAASIPVMGVRDQYQWAYPGGIQDVRGGSTLPVIANCSSAAGEPTCSARMTAAFTSHPNFDDYWAARAVDVASIKVPMLFVQGLQDFMMAYYDNRNAVIGDRSNVATVIGPWPHSVPEQTSPELKNVYLAWFDRWVADMPNVPETPKVALKGLQGQDWDGFAAWPPKSSEPKTFYLTNSGLEQNAPSAGTLQYAIDTSGNTTGLTLATTFSSATTLAGPVEISLPLSFTASDANVIANIYARRNGEQINLGWAAYKKASHLESDAGPSPRVPGRTYLYKISVPSKFYAFQPGDSMVLSVVSSDKIVASDSPAGTVTVTLGKDAYVRAPMVVAR